MELSLNLAAIVSGTIPPSVRQRVRFLHHVDLDELVQAGSPFAVSGDATAMSEQLLERRDRLGVSYVTVAHDQMDAFAPVVARLAGK